MLQIPLLANARTPLTAQAVCDQFFESIQINDPQNALLVNWSWYPRYQEQLQLVGNPPPYLLIHFKRVDYSNQRALKIDDPVRLPRDLIDLSKAFGKTLPVGTKAKYKIAGALIHESQAFESNFGHHKTLVKRLDSWYEVNDNTVTPLDYPLDQLEKAYMWVLERT